MTLEVVNHIGDLSIVDPPNTDSETEGDDHIRNIKKALQADMPVEHQTTGANAGAHKLKMGSSAARPAAGVVGRPYFNTDTLNLQRDDGTAWQDVAALPRYAQDTSVTPNLITVALLPPSPTVSLNQTLFVRVAVTNTGATNINVDALGNVPVKKIAGGVVVDLEAGDILATQIIELKYNPAGTPFFQLLSLTANEITNTQVVKLNALKPRFKDHGTQTIPYALDLSLADLHIINVNSNITITISSSSFTSDKATLVIRNQNNFTITLAGIDNDSPTLTVGIVKQDILALIKSFGKISCVGQVLNRSAV